MKTEKATMDFRIYEFIAKFEDIFWNFSSSTKILLSEK